nr:retrotransposon Gag domain-containing protein [Tanacetum cinerariifolium]
MPPKQSKADVAKKQKVVEDKTFGLKNKNKSKNVQKYVQQIQQSAVPKPDPSKLAAKAKDCPGDGELEAKPTAAANEAGGPSNTLLEQDTEDPIMQFVVQNFDRMNAMCKAFTQKIKSTPVLTSTDPSVIEPWNSDSDDVPAKSRENIFVESDNSGPPKSRATTGPTPLTDAVKERPVANNDFYHEPFIFKESDKDWTCTNSRNQHGADSSILHCAEQHDSGTTTSHPEASTASTGRLFKDLIAMPLSTLEDLFTQTDNFIRAEDANNEYRLREAHRETKQHVTYKDLPRINKDKHVSRSANQHMESPRIPREAFTALVKSPSEILATSEGKYMLRPPPRMFTPASKRDRTRYCEFHEDHGHETNDCIDLGKEIEACVRSGRLAYGQSSQDSQ